MRVCVCLSVCTTKSSTRHHLTLNLAFSLLQQRHFQLLGRAVSIPELLSERFNRMLRASVDHAIARFEARDITSIMELEGI